MRWQTLRRADVVRDTLLDIFHPADAKPRLDCGIDGCKAPHDSTALISCLRHGYAAPYLTRPRTFYCCVPPTHVPHWVQARFEKDEEGFTWRVCPYRMRSWATGPALRLPTDRIRPHGRQSIQIRGWLRTKTISLTSCGSLHAATARGFIHDDWSDVDSSPHKTAWVNAENAKRRRDREERLTGTEADNAWRTECQCRLFDELWRLARTTRPWERGRHGM